MSATGLDVFDRTLQTTNIWLNEICETIGPDRKVAWKVLSVVLHKLRDRIPVPLAAHLGAELPLLVRGVYYDQFQPGKQPSKVDFDEFMADVGKWLSDTHPIDPQDAVTAVFGVLSHHIAPEQIAKVQNALPQKLRAFWVSARDRLLAGDE